MKTSFLLSLVFIWFASIASAEEVKIKGAEIIVKLSDKTFQLIQPKTKYNIRQLFQKAGVTHYIVDGAVQQGLWRVDGDKYCSSWPPANIWDCYDILVEGETVIFLSARGARYVMIPSEP